MENEQITIFDAIAKFGARFGHLGRSSSLYVDNFNIGYTVDIVTKKTIDGEVYTKTESVDLRTATENENIQSEDHGSWIHHRVQKLYGRITIHGSFIEDKKVNT